MKLIKIPSKHLRYMESKGFIEIDPYTHKNPLVRWLFWKRLGTMLRLSKQSKRVLDFGAGSGIFMPTLSRSFPEVHSFDLNTDSLEYVKKIYGLSNVKITRGDKSKNKIPYEDNFFDVIFAADVLEHFKDSSNIQKEFKRIIRKGGYLIVSGPTENRMYALARKFLYMREKPVDHYTDIQDVMKKSSKLFKIEKIKILPFCFIPGFRVYRAKKI